MTLQWRGTYDTLNNWLLDFRMENTPISASGEIGVIAIDPQSLQDIGTWPWSRSVHGAILDRLVELGAAVVLYDVNFAFASDPEGDSAFADALDRAGGGTLLASFSQLGLDGNILYSKPYAPFAERSWPALVTVTPDVNGQIRHYPTGATIDGLFVPSAGVQLAGSYANSNEGFVINYGISPATLPVFSVSDLLNGQVTAEDVAGRSFLIGAAAADLGDNFAVPLHQVIPGVFIHAIAAETMLQGAAIYLISPIWLAPLLFLLLCALQFAGRRTAWRLVSLAFLSGFGIELAAMMGYWSSFSYLPTAMFHPALIVLAVVRLAKNVDLSRILIKRQEVQMQNSERLREHIFTNSSDGFLAINNRGEIIFQSDMAKRLLGAAKLPDSIRRTVQALLARPETSPVLEEMELRTQSGTKSIELHANVSELQTLDGQNNLASEPLALITLRDVTDLKQKQRQIEYLSRHDNQTSALRRHSFREAVEDRLARGEEISVVALSLRRLTAINTTLGRQIGDQIIVEAADRLMGATIGLGEVARVDGNVFCVIIPASPSGQPTSDTCRQIQDVLTRPYQVEGSQIHIGLHIGYAAAGPDDNWEAEDYLSRALYALANARISSDQAPTAYDSADGARRDRSRRLEHALVQALERSEFHLLYQPQYRLSDQTLIGAEALIRWQSEEFGFVSPAEFIPIAESSGFITELGNFVLEQSIETALALPEHITMSPNVSVFQLLSADFAGRVKRLLTHHGLAPERLVLELTESEFLHPESEAVQRMREIGDLGVSWALDDFGTGYSSLSYLKDLPFDKIKLDRAFLKDIFDDPTVQTTLRSVVQLVHGYGKTLLCEGAETGREVALLNEYGCDSVQGFYFGRPETFEELKQRAASDVSATSSRAALRKLG